MKLGNLLSITKEDVNVYVYQDGEIVSYYDGINSIDMKYNNSEVITMWTENNNLYIEIEL